MYNFDIPIDIKREITIHNKNYWEVGLSAGPFYSFLKSQELIFSENNEGLYEVQNKQTPSSGVAAFTHLSFMVRSNYGFGISNGVGIGLTDRVKWQYMLGLSGVFGLDNKLYANFGIAWSRVNNFNDLQLEEKFISSEEMLSLEKTISQGLHESIEKGLYLSVSYFINL